MKKLDKSKPYGTISGDTSGRVYEQDNAFFNGDGTEWVEPEAEEEEAEVEVEKPKAKPAAKKTAKPAAKPAAKKAVAPVAPVSPVDAQVQAQLKG